jgi:protein-disulfide isomerase
MAIKVSMLQRAKATLDVVSTLAVIVAAVVLTWALLHARTVPGIDSGGATASDISDLRIEAAKITNVQGHGRAVIVEFSDFQCQYCGRHARETLPAIRRQFVETGQARYIAFHFPLDNIHPQARKAAEAAECAGRQGQFWRMHERLFVDPQALTPEQFARHAQAIGLDEDRFDSCMAGGALERVRADQAEGRRLGVFGTPSFFLGTIRDDGSLDLVRRIAGFASVATFQEEIDKLVRK